MTWAQRLARVFKIDVTLCERCGGPVRILAELTDPGGISALRDGPRRGGGRG